MCTHYEQTSKINSRRSIFSQPSSGSWVRREPPPQPSNVIICRDVICVKLSGRRCRDVVAVKDASRIISLVSGSLIASITSKSMLRVTINLSRFLGKQPIQGFNDEQKLQSKVRNFLRFSRLRGSTCKSLLLSNDSPCNFVACPIEGGSAVNWFRPRDR